MRWMLLLALAGCSIACSGHGPAGPAWPKPASREADGGESLAPRAAARAIVEDDRPAERAAAATPAAAPAPAASATASAAVVAPAAAAAQDEPLPTEEIVIEVDD